MLLLDMVKEISLSSDDFHDLVNRATGNPIAEDEIPEMLKQALAKGIRVTLTDTSNRPVGRLSFSNGQFVILRP